MAYAAVAMKVSAQHTADSLVEPSALVPSRYVRYNVHMKKSMTATDARKNFFKLIEIAGKPGKSVVITREGMPDVVMLSADEFEGWQETLEIMSYNDPAMDKDILEGIKEMKSGKRPKNTVSLEKLKKELAR